jgi:hypothetical protein
MEFKHTPEHLRPLVKPEHFAEVAAHFCDTQEARQRLEEALAKKPEWLTEIEKAGTNRNEGSVSED